MRVSRYLLAAGLAVLVGVGSVTILSAQAKTDEDYDKLMKGVGAANGAMRKAADAAATQEELRVLELIRHRLEVDRLSAAAIERGARARHARVK